MNRPGFTQEENAILDAVMALPDDKFLPLYRAFLADKKSGKHNKGMAGLEELRRQPGYKARSQKILRELTK